MDKQKFLTALAKTPHFALYALAVIASACHEAALNHLISLTPAESGWLGVTGIALGLLGYGLGASWAPPRRPWTDEERAAKGLPPVSQSPKQ